MVGMDSGCSCILHEHDGHSQRRSLREHRKALCRPAFYLDALVECVAMTTDQEIQHIAEWLWEKDGSYPYGLSHYLDQEKESAMKCIRYATALHPVLKECHGAIRSHLNYPGIRVYTGTEANDLAVKAFSSLQQILGGGSDENKA